MSVEIKPCEHSALDDDLYKAGTQHAIAHEYPYIKARYEFFNRGGTMFPEGFGWALHEQVQFMSEIMLQRDESEWLRTCPSLKWLPPPFADFLTGFRLKPEEVIINPNMPDPMGRGNLNLGVEGLMYSATRWEVPLLFTLSELRNRMLGFKPDPEWQNRLIVKCQQLEEAGCDVTDFGSRRRFSYDVQDAEVGIMKNHCKTFRGTSNLHLAMKHGVAPKGTHPHEWFLLHAALYGPVAANQMAMEAWQRVYNGQLGTALTDTLTTEVFLRTFDHKMARLWDGLRQDSGDPLEWGYMIIRAYEALGIDPMTKLCVFSDNLNVDKAIQIKKEFEGKLRVAFGIGTNLSNDCGHPPLNIVIKATAFEINGRWVEVSKLSDDPGKITGTVANLYKQMLGI